MAVLTAVFLARALPFVGYALMCLMPKVAADSESEASEEAISDADTTTSSILLLPVLWEGIKKKICRLCDQGSDSASPLVNAREGDQFGGRRPWRNYKKSTKDGVTMRRACGRICSICWNVFRQKGRLSAHMHAHMKL
jgi:hypothetical protein